MLGSWNDARERRIAPKALDTIRRRVQERIRRAQGLSLSQIIEVLTPYFIGWRSYFGVCPTPPLFTNLEAWPNRHHPMLRRGLPWPVSPLSGVLSSQPREWDEHSRAF